ncbi:hypothetical protein AN191_13620 [Loktanella sp. 5RATIMAR09]|nr:hypothetical protein AN191_13620 [Loktanella sp. 5RATIMAR09]
MRRQRTSLLNFKVFAVVFALSGSDLVAQENTAVPLDQASSVAAQALIAGDPALALQIAEAVLAQRPDDRTALIVVAAAAPQLGDAARGRAAGARAFAVSQSDAQRYEAARLTALAAANDRRYTLATFWLRRALTVAPNEQERNRTLNDARGVSRLNPWSTGLSFSLAPSNNVNGGAEDEASTAPGNPTGTLSADAQAIAGWRGVLAFNTNYRLHQSRQSRTTVGAQYRGTRVRITDDIDIPDEAFTSDYSEVSLRHERALENGTISLRATRGLYEYRDLRGPSGAQVVDYEYYDIWRLGIDRQLPLNAQTVLSFSVGREWLEYQNAGIGEVNRVTVGTGLVRQLESRDRIGGNITLVDNKGDNVNYTSRDLTLSGNYRWAEPLGPITLGLGGGFRWSDYPDYNLLFAVTGGRQDRTVFANADIGFPGISYAGFTPGLRIDANRTDSNVSRFDRTTFSASLTISSQF